MIKGIGIDLIELDRIESSLNRSDRLADRILTINEKEVFHHLTTSKRKIEFLAGRFAAKEAFSKAAGSGIGSLSFQDIEILSTERGAPAIFVNGFEQANLFISITHSRDYAVAQVVIEE